MFETCYQINLQRAFGGGEVYTAFFARALQHIGIATALFVHPQASAWRSLALTGVRIEPLPAPAQLAQRLNGEPPAWIACHSLLPPQIVEALRAQGHIVTAFAHMPLYGRDPAPLRAYDLIFAVSRHVIASAQAAGLTRLYPEPMYGIADLDRAAAGDGVIRRRSPYDWDRRKLRDRALGWIEPVVESLRPHPTYRKRAGLTLGIVSRLTPIKQFPLMFRHLVPALARQPNVSIEIFGSGGYASVRDLRAELDPLGKQVRWWGHQRDVGSVYRLIDFLLSGLPEKEALGLNIIEAQACRTPVLAPDAPPFDETVLHGATGLRYRDPRGDGGADFERTLQLILGGFRFDAEAAQPHLAQFSETAFVDRVRALVESLAHELGNASATSAVAVRQS